MKVEIFSDFSCPFCYIGEKELERAIEEAGYTGQVEIEFKAFQIDSGAPKEKGQDFYEYLIAYHKVTLEEAKQMTVGIVERAKEVGLAYNYDDMKTAHTEKAHRLSKWTKQYSKEVAYHKALMAAYHIEGKDLNDEAVLLTVIEDIGLNVVEAKEVLSSSDAFIEELNEDRYDAQQIGVQSVPFFVFENRYGIKGAEPNEVFVRTLHQTAEMVGVKSSLKMVGNGENACADGECKL
ncbi:DsbA family oxidoreductase [Lysinibacillus sp. NPDC048646]|uniref:DsbA family oxidoreductase n=1 Tax=Lysinibacillus sp. NPDC048646 TaxID=3390574 RepID=UPI003D021371